MKRPDVGAVLAPLKPFQRRTVEHAFHRLFLAKDSTARFLVADEVGLGKTLVARGIIGRTIDHLWDKVDRIDIIYICSNSSIARANLPKLQIGSGNERSVALATRLTMLATELAPRDGAPGLADSKLNFISFTPSTSFEMGHSTGKSAERVVLFRLLEPLVTQRTALMNLLQGNISNTDNWRRRLENSEIPLEPIIERDFHSAVRGREELFKRLRDALTEWFSRTRETWPKEARRVRNELIGDLRQILAEICVQGLQPDLVILDEFQRFKELFEQDDTQRDPSAVLAQALFNATTPEGQPVRTLLLSATPYKLYTADAEIEHEDHYEDFLGTTRFLFDYDESRVQALKVGLSRFGNALKLATTGHTIDVANAKAEVESSLRAVMSRTERVGASEDRDAMLEEPRVDLQISEHDVEQYLVADALFKSVGDRDPMPFWKSAPYLAHFMRGYKFNDHLGETLERSPAKIAKVIRKHSGAFLEASTIKQWRACDLANAKLRDLAAPLLDAGIWKLLWIPPTIPYWPLSGPFVGHEGLTKTLLFSAWNVVPDVISGLLSYEVERLMIGRELGSYSDIDSDTAPEIDEDGPLLRNKGQLLSLHYGDASARTSHRLFLLLLPILPLADDAHPLAAPYGVDSRGWVRECVERLLADPRLPNRRDGAVDARWEWAAPIILDPGLRRFLERWKESELPRPNPKIFPEYVDDFLNIDLGTLGRRPEGLVDLLTEVALGAPGVLAARTLKSTNISDASRRDQAVQLADSFWRQFNLPAVTMLLRQLQEQEEGTNREEGYYWRLVLRYCRDGNLQSVIDEEFHLIWEQHAWSESTCRESASSEAIWQLAETVKPHKTRVHARFFEVGDNDTVKSDEIRLRTSIALRFGDIRTEERSISQDAVRRAFNSPFRPFVLASTSVGQEGLDFHPWCHRVSHWDLPGTPVDLEQREGRVNRYKGHAVRRNVAHSYREHALRNWTIGQDLWALMFSSANLAARERSDSDLIPHWMAAGVHRVLRHVPLLPYTAEVEAFRRLKRQLAAYRVVFGQPRQEELMTLLDKSSLDLASIRNWAIDLQPPTQTPEIL